MSKRVSNKGNSSARKGTIQGRQRVRFGWRKRRQLAIAEAVKQQLRLTTGGILG